MITAKEAREISEEAIAKDNKSVLDSCLFIGSKIEAAAKAGERDVVFLIEAYADDSRRSWVIESDGKSISLNRLRSALESFGFIVKYDGRMPSYGGYTLEKSFHVFWGYPSGENK